MKSPNGGPLKDEESRLPLMMSPGTVQRKDSRSTADQLPTHTGVVVYSGSAKAIAALFYAGSSLAVIFANKLVLTSYGFPSFNMLAASQFLATSLIMLLLHVLGRIQLSKPSVKVFRAVMPLSMLFLLNVVSGLGGTQRINLPMFTALRRFSILMTMLMEQFHFNSKPSSLVQLSVGLMLGGAIVAALRDLTFDMLGYFMILGNDFFTAAYGVAMKSVMSNGNVSKTSLMFYTSAFGAMVLWGLLFLQSAELNSVAEFEAPNPYFWMIYFTACIMGCVLNYSIFLCTSINSALTTTVVGCAKNVLTTYVGLFISDYVFDMLNFVGLNISIIGSIVYGYAQLQLKQQSSKASQQQLR